MTDYLILDTTPLLAAAVSGIADQFLPSNNGGKQLIIPQDVINEIFMTNYPSAVAAQNWLNNNKALYQAPPAVLPPGTKNAGEIGIGQYIQNNLSGQNATVVSENPSDWQKYIYIIPPPLEESNR